MNSHQSASPSLLSRVARRAVRWLVRPIISGSGDVPARRKRLERIVGMTQLPAPICTSIEPTTLRGVAAEWISNGRVTPKRTVLYFHGGAYLMGSPATHRQLTTRIAKRWQARVASVDYRLAPEHPFPAATDDALAAYRALLEQGVDPATLVIAGDSAGGGLALACALQVRDGGLPLPAALVLFSPWTDLSLSGASMQGLANQDDMLDPDRLRDAANTYLDGAAATTALASPLNADLHGLPPVLIQVSDCEVLLDDSRRLLDSLHAAGSPAHMSVWHGMHHVWPLFAGLVPEADAALDEAATLLDNGLRPA
ncbi:alpha/beta hydrolase [Sinimarinibacterium sp. CAU 1509]|uniref:alpha/beta hydrolase n=1 Tax=Sinimarinibacterium sp. CAU 1509 TaxID=2562283 RepID=UPI0010AD4A59|nr:alpha/beta hydrolase [Sinimarinibacterium sp. CAU 1509]TJY63195.1 alpha/beta hydrolase [Sinimarinibacterium sp. CAU 1509]